MRGLVIVVGVAPMLRTRRIRCAAYVGQTLVLLLFCIGEVGAQTLDQIINESLDAAGGRDAIEAVTSLRRTGMFTMSTPFGDIEGDTEVVIIPNRKIYQDFDSDFFQQTSAWNGITAWRADNTQGLVELEGEPAVGLIAQTGLHPFLAYDGPQLLPVTFELLEDADVEGQLHHVVTASVEGVTFTVFVDAATKLVFRVQSNTELPQLGPVTITADSVDYTEQGGVMWPARSLLDIPGLVTIDSRFNSTELNVDVDQSIFEKP